MTDPGRAERLDELGEPARELLRGAVDLHVHAAPDPVAERKMDAREVVAAAGEAGMAALGQMVQVNPAGLLG